MATKDYKKITDKKYFIAFYKEKDSINIWIFSNDKKNWMVDLDDGEKLKTFKTKSQALAFAKQYMRNN